jgi:hypothetical protein
MMSRNDHTSDGGSEDESAAGNAAGNDEKFNAIAFMKNKDQTTLAPFIEMNMKLGERKSCVSKNTSLATNCHCLDFLADSPDFCQAVSEYQVMFVGYKSDVQKKIVIEWLRNSRDQSSFRIPFLLDNNHDPADYLDLKNAKVCHHSLMELLTYEI